MSNSSKESPTVLFFGPVIATYTRAQAIEEGVLVEAGAMAREVGFKWPVVLTAAAWADCVAWTEENSGQQVYQDQLGRLWDVLYMASLAVRTGRGSADQVLFQLDRVPRDGQSTEAQTVTLKLIVGLGDEGESVITILLPNED